MLRSVNIARNAGVFAILVHALHDPARQFYLARGFVQSTAVAAGSRLTAQSNTHR
jgi:hypothetical protein